MHCRIHYTHWQLIVHILIGKGTLHELEVEHSAACRATAIDQAVFVATDLQKYTSCKDAIKSNVKSATKISKEPEL